MKSGNNMASLNFDNPFTTSFEFITPPPWFNEMGTTVQTDLSDVAACG